MLSDTHSPQYLSPTNGSHEVEIDSSIHSFHELIDRFGFHPRDSVLVRWLVGDREILAQRADLPELDCFEDWWPGFIKPLEHYAPANAQIFVHSYRGFDYFSEFSEEILRELHHREIRIDTCLYLDRSQARLLSCSGNCDEHDWDPSFLGSLPQSRDQLVAQFEYEPSVGITRKARRHARQNFSPEDLQWRADEVEYISQYLMIDQPVSESIVARIAMACTDIRIRDVILWSIATGRIKDRLAAEKFSDLLPHLRGKWAAPTATMSAICWWVSGNGAKANICVARALHHDPTYSLATLVQAALVHGVSANFWVESVSGLTREQCLGGVQELPTGTHGVQVADPS